MGKKIQVTYRVRPELNEKLAEYTQAKAQTRTYVLNTIIEKYLSSKKVKKKIQNILIDKSLFSRKNTREWKLRCDYLYSTHYDKIKIIAKAINVSISEVMDEILEEYLSKIDSNEILNETLAKIFI